MYAKSFYRPTAQAVEPILTRDTPTDAYSRRVVPFGGRKTVFSHLTLCSLVFSSRSFVTLSFLPRDAMHKRGICCHPVSVRPSVTFVSCAKTNKDIFEIFSPSGSQAILVFPYQTEWRCSDGNPLIRGRRMQGGMKKWRFSTNISNSNPWSRLFLILALAEVCTLYYCRQKIFNQQDTERLTSPIFNTLSLVRAITVFSIEKNGISDICCFRGVILSPYNCS